MSDDRRSFLRSAGRIAFALGMGGGIGALTMTGDGVCREPGLCRGCARLDECELPEAVSLKQAEQPDEARTDGRQT